MREFYTNNTMTLENICKIGEKAMDMTNMDRIPVRGVMVNLSIRTIKIFLHGANFIHQPLLLFCVTE